MRFVFIYFLLLSSLQASYLVQWKKNVYRDYDLNIRFEINAQIFPQTATSDTFPKTDYIMIFKEAKYYFHLEKTSLLSIPQRIQRFGLDTETLQEESRSYLNEELRLSYGIASGRQRDRYSFLVFQVPLKTITGSHGDGKKRFLSIFIFQKYRENTPALQKHRDRFYSILFTLDRLPTGPISCRGRWRVKRWETEYIDKHHIRYAYPLPFFYPQLEKKTIKSDYFRVPFQDERKIFGKLVLKSLKLPSPKLPSQWKKTGLNRLNPVWLKRLIWRDILYKKGRIEFLKRSKRWLYMVLQERAAIDDQELIIPKYLWIGIQPYKVSGVSYPMAAVFLAENTLDLYRLPHCAKIIETFWDRVEVEVKNPPARNRKRPAGYPVDIPRIGYRIRFILPQMGHDRWVSFSGVLKQDYWYDTDAVFHLPGKGGDIFFAYSLEREEKHLSLPIFLYYIENEWRYREDFLIAKKGRLASRYPNRYYYIQKKDKSEDLFVAVIKVEDTYIKCLLQKKQRLGSQNHFAFYRDWFRLFIQQVDIH